MLTSKHLFQRRRQRPARWRAKAGPALRVPVIEEYLCSGH